MRQSDPSLKTLARVASGYTDDRRNKLATGEISGSKAVSTSMIATIGSLRWTVTSETVQKNAAPRANAKITNGVILRHDDFLPGLRERV